MSPHYRHTQLGWVTIVAIVLLGGLIVTQATLLRHRAAGAGIALAATAVLLACFTRLTVEVDGQEIRLRFTGGLIRRRITLTDVAGFRAVRNHWLSGWGIRKVSGGWMWNVSGLDAVELALTNGRVFRIGTDDAPALLRAIERVAGPAPPQAAGPPRVERGPLLALVAILLLVASSIAVSWFFQTRPPKVTLTAGEVRVRSLFYSAAFKVTEIRGLTLERELPRVLARTNGFEGGGSLRGRFELEGLGKGKLFLERGRPPYVVVRLDDGFLIVGYEQPGRSETLFAGLQRLRGATP